MRVGVYLDRFEPNAGGAYIFQAEVFRALLETAGSVDHEFFVLYEPGGNISDSIPTGGSNVRAVRLDPPSYIEQLCVVLRSESALMGWLLRRRGRIERAASRARLNMVWYVCGGAYEPIDIPYIATVWDLQHRTHPWFPEVSERQTWFVREIPTRAFLQRATFVVVGTETGRDEVRRFFQVPPDRIRKLPHPTPMFALQAGAHGSGPNVAKYGLKSPFLFYPAQFWAHKNHVNMLLALQLLRERDGLELPLALTGSDKGNLDHVRSLCESLGLGSQVRILGYVEQQNLVGLYRSALALIYPSFSGPENLPPLEAFALGCPVIAADVPGAREQLGDAAIFFDPRDPGKIADAIKSVYTNNELRDSLVAKGRMRASAWTTRDFVNGVYAMIDEFVPIRRCWNG
jgi:glycosyltransferase involved in cell wall biosynthesis